jgi:hypothetical protein
MFTIRPPASAAAAARSPGQHDRGAQVRLQVRVPGRAVGGLEAVEAEGGGVVDQQPERAEGGDRRRHERLDLGLARQVGRQDDGPPAPAADRRRHLLGLGQRVVAVDGDVEPVVRQRLGHRAPQALASTGHQRASWHLGHVVPSPPPAAT